MKNLVRECLSLFRFFFRTSINDKQVVFYAEHEGYFVNFEGIINELTTAGQKICYVTSDPTDPVFHLGNSAVKTYYLNSLLSLFMRFVTCRVFVMTMTDLDNYYLKRSINTVHYVYVFHSMVSTHMMYSPGAFDHYDSILCVGPHHIEEIRKYEEMHNLPAKDLVEGGYYRLERIHEKHQQHPGRRSGDEKSTVLIAPSWGEDNVLEVCGEALIEILLKSGYKVIVRPHPETVRRTPELITKLQNTFASDEKLTIEVSVATDDSLIDSDVLICDCSGVALEYAFGTERPVLFIDVPPKVKNDDFRQLGIEPMELFLRAEIGVLLPLEQLIRVVEHIDVLVEENEKYRKKIVKTREKYVFAYGQSSKIGARHILDLGSTRK